MTTAARESTQKGSEVLPVVGIGTVTEITVDASQDFALLALGVSPDVTSNAIRIPASSPEYFKVVPGSFSAEAKAGATTNSTSSFSTHCTVVRVLYDATAGIVEIMEGAE